MPFGSNAGPTLTTVFDVIDSQGVSITEGWIQQCIDHYQSTDDVFQIAFLQGVIFQAMEEKVIEVTESAQAFLAGKGMQWFHCFPLAANRSKLHSGPYVILDGHLREVWRLYNDTNGAFFSAFRADSNR